MADILLNTYTFRSSVDTWVTGDYVKIYWDDAAEAIKVTKNGVEQVGGGDDLTSGYVSSPTNYQFCDGDNLVYFIEIPSPAGFPYMYQNVSTSDGACVANPEGCSISIGISGLTKETPDQSDASFQVQNRDGSSGEAALQFFQYGDGTGQTLPATFTGLSKGVYTLHIKDDNNCYKTQEITVLEATEYQTLYRCEWYDLQGNINRFDIQERGYQGAGGITEKNTGSNPFALQINGNSVNSFYDISVKTSSCTLNIMNTTNFEFKDLFTQDDKKYKGIWYLNIGGAGLVERWRGFLLPSVFNEPYINPPYPTALTFVDGLEDLKYSDYAKGLPRLRNQDKVITIIARILQNTGHDLPIRVGVNMYSASMGTAATDDPLDQVYIDNNTLYRKENEEVKPLNNYEILNDICKSFGARIYQSSGYWYITRPEEERSSSYDYREFDYLGVYSSNGSISPNLNIDNATATNRLVFSNRSGNYGIYPAYGKITINNDLNVSNVLANGDFNDIIEEENNPQIFNDWTFVPTSGTSLNVGTLNGNNFCAIRTQNVSGNESARDARIISSVRDIEISSADYVSFSYKYAFDRIKGAPWIILRFVLKLSLGGTDYYLKEDGDWSTSRHVYRSYPNYENDFAEFQVSGLAPQGLSGNVTGTTQVEIYNYCISPSEYPFPEPYTPGTNDDTLIRGIATTGIDFDYKVDGEQGDATVQNIIRYYSLIASEEVDDFPNIVRPDDYSGTNKKVWQLDATSVPTFSYDENDGAGNVFSRIRNEYFYIDDVSMSVLPNGDKMPTNEQVSVTNNTEITENKTYSLIFADVAQYPNGDRVVNDLYNFDDYFRRYNTMTSEYEAITDWSRDGQSENLTIQKILVKTLSSQFSTPTDKISGSFTTDEGGSGSTYIFPFNTIVNTFDNNKVYAIDGMTFNSKMNEYTLELIEIKALSLGGGANSFSGDFSNDFGNSFDTTYN